MASHESNPEIVRWSSDIVPAAQRFDYFADALSAAIVPMRAARLTTDAFGLDMTMMDCGGVAILHQSGSAHRSYRNARDLSRSGDHTFHLLVNLTAPMKLEHKGRIVLGPGDVALVDSNIGHVIDLDSDFEVVHLKLTEAWLRRWLPVPDAMIGRRIDANRGWGQALSAFASRLSPQALTTSALPIPVLCDQVGGLLSLVGMEVAPRPALHADALLRKRVHDGINQRSHERSLMAEDIAAMLAVPVDAVHAALAACGETFGECLTEIRLRVAVRMLASPILRKLSVPEIASRAGFADARHLNRVLQARLGTSAPRLRAQAGIASQA